MAGRFAIVTGASTGIGYELARLCAREGYDLLVEADEPEIQDAARSLREQKGAGAVEAVHVDLATMEGVDQLYAAAKSRPVDVLMANAGRGLGHAFLDQQWPRIREVIDTNVLGTTYLVHKVGQDMRGANQAGS
jgi:short-subunit dehydrogenase